MPRRSEWPIDLPAAAHQASHQLAFEIRGYKVRSTAEYGIGRLSPVTLHVRKLEQLDRTKYYIANEVAKELGVSVQAIRKYAKREVCGSGVAPSKKVPFGDIEINLYTEEDLNALRSYLDQRKVVYTIKEANGTGPADQDS